MERAEVGVIDSIFYGIIVLLGERGKDWDYDKDLFNDPLWWTLRLWSRRN
ncbi:hypothetical protein ES703_32101 [subsurface metagenome]